MKTTGQDKRERLFFFYLSTRTLKIQKYVWSSLQGACVLALSSACLSAAEEVKNMLRKREYRWMRLEEMRNYRRGDKEGEGLYIQNPHPEPRGSDTAAASALWSHSHIYAKQHSAPPATATSSHCGPIRPLALAPVQTRGSDFFALSGVISIDADTQLFLNLVAWNRQHTGNDAATHRSGAF